MPLYKVSYHFTNYLRFL